MKYAKILKYATIPVALALPAAIFLYGGVYTLSFQESLGTYYAIPAFVKGTLAAPGGLAQLVSAWLTQYFADPYLGAAIMMLLLTAIAWVAGCVAVRTASRQGRDAPQWLRPLGMLPAVSLALLNYNVNYSNAGTVAMLIMYVVLWAVLVCLDRLKAKCRSRLWLAAKVAGILALVLALSYACGAVAVLFGVLLCVSGFRRGWPRVALGAACVVVAAVLAVIYVRQGYFGDFVQAVSPLSYFTLRLKFGAFVYTPWILAIVVMAVAVASDWMRDKRPASGVGLWIVAAVVSAAYAAVGCASLIDRQNERFKQLMYYTGRGDWDAVVASFGDARATNVVHQNLLNMALAEKGMLADRLFLSPCIDIRSIYIEGDKTPYMQALLSDIYYSMGHIALAQRNAFEANESLGNLSPRQLRRLAQTNLIYGHYAVAEKYIRLLESTRHYKAEAEKWRTMLYDDRAVLADPELGPKRRCLFPDNRFSASRGLDDDLRQILRANPEHQATLQYLGSLYLLSKDVPSFAGVVDEFYPVGSQLPEAYAEAMTAAFSDKTDSIASRYRLPDGVRERYGQFLNSPQSQESTFWYYFNFRQ